jgi:multiple sugar transport system permease protein
MAQRRSTSAARRHTWNGLIFCSPAIVGLTVLSVYPLAASLYYSFCSYSALKSAKWVGMANYQLIWRDLTHRGLLFDSAYNTLFYGLFAVPLGIGVAFLLALLLNQKVRGQAWFRTMFYVPSVVPIVASSILWLWLLNPQYGLINKALEWSKAEAAISAAGVRTPIGWLADPLWAKPGLILMTVWGVGNWMVIFLAGLQNVPQELYEAAEIDGATPIQKTWTITLPILSPQLLFMGVMGLIGAFQFFTQAWVMTNGTGSPANATLMYPMYLFQNAFLYFKMGYACAMAWLLFAVTLAITGLVFRLTGKFIHYGGEVAG